MPFTIHSYGLTDTGRQRTVNQDQFLTARLNKSVVVDQSSIPEDDHARILSDAQGWLLLVADGMGGHAAGEVASRIAVDAALAYVLNTIPWFYRLSKDCDEDFVDELKHALNFCQQELASRADAQPALRNMGTTLTMAYILGQQLYGVHVGDSRCYVLREGRLHQLTHDHTMAEKLVEQGAMRRTDVEKSPLSHVLWNALGGSEHSHMQPEVYKCGLRAGDDVLLCTDGLNRHVTDEQICQVLLHKHSLQQRCQALVAAANEGGGSDNITVLLASVSETVGGKSYQVADETSQLESPRNASLHDTDPHLPAR